MSRPIGRFHVLTDYHFQQRFSHAELARFAIDGGADSIQFRQKTGGIRHVLRSALECAEVCADKGIPMLVDDRVDIVQACGAAGIHLGQSDFPVDQARRILGTDAVIGGSASTLDEAIRMQDAGADYVGFGPVFRTSSKRNPAPVRGLRMLRQVCSALDIPVIAIAGVTASRIEDILGAGAHGVAVMTAVTNAEEPADAARAIRRALDEVLSSPTRSTNGQRN